TPTPTATAIDDLGTGQTDGSQQVFATTVPTQIPGADCFHEVKAQDQSLYRLSLAYGTTVNSIATASGIVNPNLIRVGQMLTIPGCGTTGAQPPPTSTPNPAAFGTGGTGTGTTNPAAAVNPTGDCTWGTSVIFPNGCPTTNTDTSANISGNAATGTGATTGTGGPGTTVGSRTHTVAQGETLFEISLTYGVTMDAIASANGITNYDQITFNDTLVIP
ncbi:MAG: LysM domain-containing protein, partial [Chloroflexota bacterium]